MKLPFELCSRCQEENTKGREIVEIDDEKGLDLPSLCMLYGSVDLGVPEKQPLTGVKKWGRDEMGFAGALPDQKEGLVLRLARFYNELSDVASLSDDQYLALFS